MTQEPFVPCLPPDLREIWEKTEQHALPTFTQLQNIALRQRWFAEYVEQKARVDVLNELMSRIDNPDFDLKFEITLLKEGL